MALRERERSGTDSPPDTWAPRPAASLRRLLAVAAALGALIAFTTLARPESSPSSRLSIGSERAATSDNGAGADRDETGGTGGTAGREPAADYARTIEGPQTLVRPLDPSTLADVPANILTLRGDEWISPSPGGGLVALRDFSDDQGRNEIRVVDARTFQPVVTVETSGFITNVHGFTPGADALVAQVNVPYPRQTILRYPLDPDQPVTEVALPESVELASTVAMLADSRIAMVVVARNGEESEALRSSARVLVADLLDERVLIDLPLPGLRAYNINGPPEENVSQALPGFAWDAARERLFIAHADAARVTIVDLVAGAVVAEADVGQPLPGIGDTPVQRWRSALVSPDGTRLYTSGFESLPSSRTTAAFGLSVIDTATLTEVGRVEEVDNVQLSPDGRWLLWSRNADWTGLGSPDEPPRVALMDTAQIGLVHLLGDRAPAYPLGFSRDSSHVYLQRDEMGRSTVVAHALPSLAETGDRLLPREAWFDPVGGLLHERG